MYNLDNSLLKKGIKWRVVVSEDKTRIYIDLSGKTFMIKQQNNNIKITRAVNSRNVENSLRIKIEEKDVVEVQ